MILDGVEAAEAALQELADMRRGRLRLGSFATAGATVLPRAVDVFRSRHPGVELHGRADRSGRGGGAACGPGGWTSPSTVDLPAVPAEGVVVTHLFDDPFRLALHPAHPLAGRADIRLEDLAEETWVSVPEHQSGGGALTLACERCGFRPRIAFESEDYTAIRELVGSGVGLAVLPDLALYPPGRPVVLRSLGPDGPRREIQAATRAEPFRSPAAAAMLGILLALEPPLRRRPRRRPGGTPARAPGR